ncbi:hypothetical protein [uncultured Piscinibacter sp.]|nr:hypothetical protein [uncultured Piscinibacter sp.]
MAIVDGDMRHGPLFRQGRVTIGVIVHGDKRSAVKAPAWRR